MKKAVLTIIEALFRLHNKFLFSSWLIRYKELKHWVFVDIDNTLADTWPSFLQKDSKSDFERVASLMVHEGMKAYITVRFSDSTKYQVVYITARHFLMIGTTRKWLGKHGFLFGESKIIVVTHPTYKIEYLKKALKAKRAVSYIDDLSYHHEKGEVKFYDSIINQVKEMGIEYIGYHDICKTNDDYKIN
jgi:hypothetical protein